MTLPITALYAGLNTLVMLSLALQTVRIRMRSAVPHGDGGNALLLRISRAHGNNAEYVPFALILLGVLEVNGISAPILYGLGSLLTVSRIAHAHGLLTVEGASPGRALGTLGTWIMLFASACIAVWTWQP